MDFIMNNSGSPDSVGFKILLVVVVMSAVVAIFMVVVVVLYATEREWCIWASVVLVICVTAAIVTGTAVSNTGRSAEAAYASELSSHGLTKLSDTKEGFVGQKDGKIYLCSTYTGSNGKLYISCKE